MESSVSDTIYAPPRAPIDILHRDDDLLIVAKPEGLLSVPGKGEALADCLETRLRADDPQVLLVHRLDRDTSGVMVFARNRAAQRHLGLQFERRHLSKGYVALVEGYVEEEKGTIDLPLKADWPNRPRQMVHPEGRHAITHWRAIERGNGATRMALHPETGRAHQLRVHMCSLGHPILGDPLYDGPDAPRMMLHSETLELRHPTGGERHTFRAPPPF
ncbi:RluA family pseudouridine synthase [Palleronia sp. LCG004]|uniref:RluA family pseudouridine synthase n=1 Tax=Palleronia sp. LCG004 TaxID=3079304 RepID=UPI0029430FE9|nr:RluA family pseudouridine synthase [Palleronia sp. LCG004]WOI56357.1 RluA family pseudouridine synthase [Palleronia sp. LCG004]